MHFLPLLFRNCSSVWKRLKETEAKHYLWRYYHSSLAHSTAKMRRGHQCYFIYSIDFQSSPCESPGCVCKINVREQRYSDKHGFLFKKKYFSHSDNLYPFEM